MTAQGHPRVIFNRAIERRNVVLAEATAREVGGLTLEEALKLVLLYADPRTSAVAVQLAASASSISSWSLWSVNASPNLACPASAP